MKKDGIADKIGRLLHDAYDAVLVERVPDDMRKLIGGLK